MSLKYYGIYLMYPPTVNLCAEGLGRHLAAFLKGTAERTDVRFVLVCPSWSKKTIEALCHHEDIPVNSFELRCPEGENTLFTLRERYQDYIKKPKIKKRFKFKLKIPSWLKSLESKAWERILISKSLYNLILNVTILVPISLVHILFGIAQQLNKVIKKIVLRTFLTLHPFFNKPLQYFQEVIFNPKNNESVFNHYKIIERQEIKLMLEMINTMHEVKAWYSPTAFWPSFNQIKAPKLMCVPDVVLNDFPVGFATVGGGRFLESFNMVEQAICSSTHFVTYSSHTKEHTLMARYNIKSENIFVIPHAANMLDHIINIKGYNDNDASLRYCKQRFISALSKATNRNYAILFSNPEVKFFFYASQFRPSKNILTLLKAYKFLLRNRFIGHKLILTGTMGVLKEIDAFIKDHHLDKDILVLPQLSLEELASCYKLADIVVNPTLSEGGCPFTFTEALSVNTPVIMSRIPVTREVITDPQLQKMMLFDPYSWSDLAERLEWAINNKVTLLNAQRKVYEHLKKRTWKCVVNDYINTLDSLTKEKLPPLNIDKNEVFTIDA